MKYDFIIIGAGIAGLWLLNTLTKSGFNVLLIEKDTMGGTQTLASQGLIHGGQRYVLTGQVTPEARSIAKMPERWQAALEGTGDIDLREVVRLSDTQVMWPAGSFFSGAGLTAAALLVNAKTKRLKASELPQALHSSDSASEGYELPESVLDTKSLIQALARPHRDRILKGEVTALSDDGRITVSGAELLANRIIFAAGKGNEEALSMLGVPKAEAQERPLMQFMVRTMEHPLYGHGIVNDPRPRVTVTSHPIEGGYLWYLGGALAANAAALPEAEAIAHAKREMTEMFPSIDWSGKEWATWYGSRAEARHANGMLSDGPALEEHRQVLIAWPTKLTFVPALSDMVHAHIAANDLIPEHTDAVPDFPTPELGKFPWEEVEWE